MLVEAAQQICHWNLQSFRNADEGLERDGPARLDLLPVTGREAVADHVLLNQTQLLAEFADSLAKRLEDAGGFIHAL